MSIVSDLKPKAVWDYFEKISQIPRCSKHEEKIRQYLLDFAKKQKLGTKMDTAGNVVILKPATGGMERNPIVVLQSHMDMVCEKNSDIDHDFGKDPITFKREGDILMATGTSLGADDGIGIATTLAILANDRIRHGPLEGLFTVDEETGLTGAFALGKDMITGRIMLNIDSEDFGVVTIGCAGGGNTSITLPLVRSTPPKNTSSLILKISGLRGGHSGVDIHEQRGNAIKIMARLLWKVNQNIEILISDFQGGNKHNAIPRESSSVIVVQQAKLPLVKKILQKELKAIQIEYKPIDPKLTLHINETSLPTSVLDIHSSTNLLQLLQALPHGVDKMNYDISKLVDTSTNLATLDIHDKKAVMLLSTRSSIMSALQDFRDRIHAIAMLAGAEVEEDDPYPGWKPNIDSKLLKLSKKIFKDIYKTDPKVEAIHAGLECGIIGEKYPGMDMISIGPTIKYPHSPEEQVHISTVDKFYYYLLRILESV